MDELTNSEIEEYLSDLPLNVLNIIQDKTWSKRVEEISTKYSLSQEQATTLKNLVLFVIIGVEEAETFADSVEKELGISKLLAEQIINDVDERVFQYIFNLISENSKDNKQEKTEEENIPEIRPEITPMVEKGEMIQVKPIPAQEQNPVNSFWQTKKEFAPDNLPGMEMKNEEQKVFIGSEFIQKPVSVPRYTGTPLDETIHPTTSSQEQQKPQSIIDAKLNSVVKMADSKETTQTTPAKYSADPYREPIE